MPARDSATGLVGDRLMRAHAAPDSDAPVSEGAGASRLPLLSGALKDRAWHMAGTLTETLRPRPAAGSRDGSLSCGSAGLAVCTGQFARTRRDRLVADAALAHLEEAVEVLTTEPLTSSLYSGFTGIAWAAEMVDRLLGTEGEDRNGDIDLRSAANWVSRGTVDANAQVRSLKLARDRETP